MESYGDGPNGGEANIFGSASAGNGELNIQREASGPNGGAIQQAGYANNQGVRIGATVATLPEGCTKVFVKRNAYYRSGSTYYRPSYNGTA